MAGEALYKIIFYYEEFLLVWAHLNLTKGSIIKYQSLKRMFKRVSREIMESVEYQYLKLLIPTVPVFSLFGGAPFGHTNISI